ncbi:MAG: hypothetical protein P4L50_25520 [Anaerolineaceae bacterium]|nr:hypothetical protein [Anaerolineaceae bacterium]
MKKKIRFVENPHLDDHYWQLTRDDLDPEEQMIYNRTLLKIAARFSIPSVKQLHMLAAYAWAASELRKASQGTDKALTIWLNKCMIYARNGLGIASPQFIDLMDLIIDSDQGIDTIWPPVYLSLDRSWQLSR